MRNKWLQAPYRQQPEPHEFITRIESHHGCGCPDKVVTALSWAHADAIAGRCIHGNLYSTQHFPEEGSENGN